MKFNELVNEEFAKLVEQGEDDEKKGGKANVGEVIKALIDTPASGENEDQGKFVQLLRGLAFSDDPKSDAFMKKLTDMINDKNFGQFTK